MDWVLDNLNVIVFLAAGVAYWLNSMRQAKEEARQQREAEQLEDFREETYTPPPHTEVFLPPPVVPPPLPGQPMVRPPRGMPEAPPTLRRSPQPQVAMAQDAYEVELERQKALEERILSLRQNREKRSGGAAATKRAAAKRNSPAPGGKPEIVQTGGIRARLRDRSEARRAIVMREILGTPVGMR
jgi:hypothetical protein